MTISNTVFRHLQNSSWCVHATLNYKLLYLCRIPVTFYEHVPVFAGWNVAVHQECGGFFGIVGNVMDRTAKAAQIAWVKGLGAFLLIFVQPKSFDLPARYKYDFFNGFVIMPVL